MDLLNMLSGLLTSSSSVNALSQKTGTDSSQTEGILSTALPMLLGALSKNASTEEGAASLLGALQQHTDTSAIEDQIANADAEDGGKIISHILGSNQNAVLQSISEKTGASTEQISSLLSNAAPGLMSGLSAVNTAASKKTSKLQAAKKSDVSEVVKKTAKMQAAKKQEVTETVKKTGKLQAAAKQAVKEEVKEVEELKEEATEEKAAGGLDLSGILGMLGGGDSKESSGGIGDLLGGLLGGKSDSGDDNDSAGSLLGMFKNLF